MRYKNEIHFWTFSLIFQIYPRLSSCRLSRTDTHIFTISWSFKGGCSLTRNIFLILYIYISPDYLYTETAGKWRLSTVIADYPPFSGSLVFYAVFHRKHLKIFIIPQLFSLFHMISRKNKFAQYHMLKNTSPCYTVFQRGGVLNENMKTQRDIPCYTNMP